MTDESEEVYLWDDEVGIPTEEESDDGDDEQQ